MQINPMPLSSIKFITGDEKWILYDNFEKPKLYVDPDPSSTTKFIHAKKVLVYKGKGKELSLHLIFTFI